MIKAVIFDILNVLFTPIPGQDFTYELNDEMRSLLWELNENKITIGYLTNSSGRKLDELIDQGILPKFNVRISSVEGCFPKPDPSIYAKLVEELEKIGIKPEEALFIDDKEQNLMPAKRIGIHTVQFRSVEQLKMSLKELKLL